MTDCAARGRTSATGLGRGEQKGGIAPDRIIASHSTGGMVDRTRPLCPYPQVAQYVGTGSIDQAENFTCTLPSALE
jgi:tannase/feruloyl esterase